MQMPFHSSTSVFTIALALILVIACQPQGGQALKADDQQWLHYATEACHRNDERAFDTLIARAGDAGEGVRCVDATIYKPTTIDDD